MKCVWALVLFSSLAFPALSAEVPFHGHGNALVVEASINNRFTGKFLLDTGASYCVVTKDVARKAKLKGRVSGEKIRLVTANGTVQASLANARKVDLGGASARDVEVAVVEEDPVPGLAGIIGLSFLGHFTYTVDAAAGVLRLDR